MNTKHGSIYTSVEEEVRAFMRPFAHSVTIAKSFTGEEKQVEDQQPEVDPFAGIDLENLSDDAKAAITKAKTEFANLQTKTKTAEANALAKDLESRKHQARADRFQTTLKSHNLDPDKQQHQQQQNPDATEIQELADEYVKEMGLTPEVALAHAKMHHISNKKNESRILKTVGEAVGPHIQAVGNMSVDRLLNAASQKEEYFDALGNDDIVTGARDILNSIVVQGGAVDATVVDTAIKLSVGEAMMKGKFTPNSNNNPVQPQKQQVRTSLFNNPQMIRNDGNRGDGSPIAKNEETAKAASLVMVAMSRGLPKKK